MKLAMVALGLWAMSLGSASASQEEPAADDPLLAEVKDLPAEERVTRIKTEIDGGLASKERWFHLGNAYYESGNPRGAADAFSQAVALDPQYFEAMVNLALMYDEQQNYAKAIEVFEKAGELKPENPDVWSYMGDTYYAQRKYPEAMELYRKALALDDSSTHALYSIGVAFADAGIFREAVIYWQRVSQLEPESALGRSASENVELLQKYLIPQN